MGTRKRESRTARRGRLIKIKNEENKQVMGTRERGSRTARRVRLIKIKNEENKQVMALM